MTTGTQGHNYNGVAGDTVGGYINDDRDTGIVRREITDRDTNDDRDTGNINDDRDTQREITNWDTGTQMTTGTQGI